MNQRTKIKLLILNVRSLNERPKRLAIRQTILLEHSDIICLLETKLSNMDDNMAREICGRYLDQYQILPADGTRGGLVIAWPSRKFDLQHQQGGTLHFNPLSKALSGYSYLSLHWDIRSLL